MISFKRFCEDFIQHDSEISRRGSGPSVTGASKNGIMQRPSPVSVAALGDTTGFTGNNVYLIRNVKTPFDFKVEESDNGFNILIKFKRDSKYIPLKDTPFASRCDYNHTSKENAQAAIRDLKFKISQVE